MDVAGVSKICCGMIHDVKIFSKVCYRLAVFIANTLFYRLTYLVMKSSLVLVTLTTVIGLYW